MELIKTNILSG